MPLPSNLQTITLTGTFLDSGGNALSGTLVFTPPSELVDLNNAALYPTPVTVTLSSGGAFSTTLICTDNPTLYPTGWYYIVTENVRTPRSYSIYVPHTLGSTVDLSALMPLPLLPGQTSPPPTVGSIPPYVLATYPNTWTAANIFQGEVTVPTPVNPTDPATKAYADSIAQGLSVKLSCQESTAAALPTNTYSNGTAGVGATLTATANGALTVDTIAVQAGDRVLVQNEATTTHNGIYVVTQVGSGSLPYILTRSTDFNTGSQVPGAFTFVELGSANGGNGFVVAGTGPYTIGTTAITWTQFSGAGNAITAGTGLTKTGAVLALASPIPAANLPAATTGAQGAVEFASSTSVLQPDGALALGSSGFVPDAGHTHPLAPHQFSVKAQGAKGDGKLSNTGATTASSNTVTIGEAVLTSGDVGKVVMVKNALQNQTTSGQTTSVGTITAVNSSTSFTATWNTTPTLTATGLQVLWGTDDTTAFQAAIAAAFTYAQAHGYAEITLPSPTGLFYAVGGVLKSTDGTNAVFNSQLTIPVNAEHSQSITLCFRGVGGGGQTRYWNTQIPGFAGSPLVSFGVFTNSTNQTNSINNGGNPSVIGGPTGKNGYGVGTPTPLFNNLCVEFRDISIINTHSNAGWTYSAANMFGVARFHASNFAYGTNGVIEYYNGTNGDFQNVTLLSGGLSAGLIMPANGNNASNYLNTVVCNGGYTYGLLATEHTVGNDVTILYCWSGLCPVGFYTDSGSNPVGALHESWFDLVTVEACNYHVNVFGVGASGVGPIIHADIDTEGALAFRDTTSGTSLNSALGVIRLAGSASGVALTAGTGLKIVAEQQTRGPVTAPTFAINTAQINAFWRDATVIATGGTGITSIQVSSLAGGPSAPTMTTIYSQSAGALAAPITFRVPAGCWWVVNGTTAPTTTWTLD